MAITILEDLCSGCESCVSACPNDAIEMNDAGKAVVIVDDCIDCGACIDECPSEAIVEGD